MRRPWERLAVNERVLVNLKTGDQAIGGVLLRQAGSILVLGDASLYALAGDPKKLDGEVFVEVADVAFAQRLGPRQ